MKIKKLIFETSKGRFVIVDMPLELYGLKYGDSGVRIRIHSKYSKRFKVIFDKKVDPDFVHNISLITEEQAGGIVDSIEWKFKDEPSLNRTVYRNYLISNEMEGDNTLFNASDSLSSLIQSKGWYLFDNPIIVPMHKSNNIKEMADYIEAEARTLHNPVIFKIK